MIRTYKCKWPNISPSIQTEYRIGRFFIGPHFPSVWSWDLGISTDRGVAGYGYAIGDGWKDVKPSYVLGGKPRAGITRP